MIEIEGQRYRWTIRATLKRLWRFLNRRFQCWRRGHPKDYWCEYFDGGECCLWCGWNTKPLVKWRLKGEGRAPLKPRKVFRG